MTFQQLKEAMLGMSAERLQDKIVIFEGDNEIGGILESIETSQEDIYWLDGEPFGNLEMTIEELGVNYEDEKENLFCVPKGTVTLHYKNPII